MTKQPPYTAQKHGELLLAVNDWFPLTQGLVQFDCGAGLEELIAAWPGLPKGIRSVT